MGTEYASCPPAKYKISITRQQEHCTRAHGALVTRSVLLIAPHCSLHRPHMQGVDPPTHCVFGGASTFKKVDWSSFTRWKERRIAPHHHCTAPWLANLRQPLEEHSLPCAWRRLFALIAFVVAPISVGASRAGAHHRVPPWYYFYVDLRRIFHLAPTQDWRHDTCTHLAPTQDVVLAE